MLPEHKALIGRECFVDVDSEKKRGEIISVLESITTPHQIILYCVRLRPRPRPIKTHYDIGTKSVQLIGDSECLD